MAGTATNAITPLAALRDSAPLDLVGAAAEPVAFAEPEWEAEAAAEPEAEPEWDDGAVAEAEAALPVTETEAAEEAPAALLAAALEAAEEAVLQNGRDDD